MACQKGDPDSDINANSVFRHLPLDTTRSCIRLLKVSPANGHAPIQCQISQVSLEDRPRFIALSYKWDHSSASSKNILCNGASMQVRKNLWDFLHRYSRRRAYTGTWLWIDAICIDQEIVQEKSTSIVDAQNLLASTNRYYLAGRTYRQRQDCTWHQAGS